ncbi:L28p-like [Trinorchestia longiramus]|nr:L28p-like [Trinorchestia longiramus]
MTNEWKLTQITKPWLLLKVFNDESYGSRLPEHYKRFYWQWKHGKKEAVHYDPATEIFKLSPCQERVTLVEQKEIQVVYPENCDDGLWGGEGVIKGFYHIGRYKGENAKYWWPTLQRSVVYSEILDKYMELVVTERALNLIDKHYGLDSYLLKTPYADINSALGFKLKKEMLLALVKQTLYPNDPEMKKEITEKYKEFIIPVEEADWIGLTLDEAVKRQKKLEEAVEPVALKYDFRAQLVQYLQENPQQSSDTETVAAVAEALPQTEKPESWVRKFNPFGKSSK